MEDPAGGAGDSTGVAAIKFSLAELRATYALLEEKAVTGEDGSRFVDHPSEALSARLDETRVPLLLDELWKRRCLAIVPMEPRDGESERAIIIEVPTEADPRLPILRYWVADPEEARVERGTPENVVCVVPSLLASDEDHPSDLEDAEGDDEKDAGDDERDPVAQHFLNNTALVVEALTALLNQADERRHVFDPLSVMREALAKHGVRTEIEQAFVNWLVRQDYLYILEIGPRVVQVRNAALRILGVQKEASAQEVRDHLASDVAESLQQAQSQRAALEYRGVLLSLDLMAAGIVALVEVADDEAWVGDPVPVLRSLLSQQGVAPVRAKGLLLKLRRCGYVRSRPGWRKTPEIRGGIVIAQDAVAFVRERRADIERRLREVEAPTVPEAPKPVIEKPPLVATQVVDDTPAPVTIVPELEEVVATEPVNPVLTGRPANDVMTAPMLVSGSDMPVREDLVPRLAPDHAIVLEAEANEILRAYLKDRPALTAQEFLSTLVLERLGPEVRKLEAALGKSYAFLKTCCSKKYTHDGKPVVFTPIGVLRHYPLYLLVTVAETQLAVMVERGWIRWVQPPSYIVLLR